MLPGREPKIKGYILIILNSLNILIEELIVDLQSILILNATYSNLLLNPHILQHSVYSESLKQFYLSQLMICAPAYSYPSPFFFPFSNNDSLFNQEISFPLKNSEETHNNLTTMNCTNTTEETKTLELEISETSSYEEFVLKTNQCEITNSETLIFITKGLVIFKDYINEISIKRFLPLMEKNVLLYQILQNLNEKYNGIKKTKEECSKYLFRKSFKFIKKNLEESQKGMMKKKIKKFYLEKYFKNKNDQKEPNQLLPFKKNSLVKRINQKYLKVLFSNENYLKEFEKFIEKYDSFVEIENQKKITKFVKQILQLIKENKIEDIKRIQHCPWLKSWIMGCKKMGQEILKEAIAQKR